MPAPAKIVVGQGLLAKLEASYGTVGSLSASTDGIQCDELPVAKLSWANDGKRPPPPGTGGNQRKVVPSAGPIYDLTAKVAPKGANAAYSASVVPNIHVLLRSCLMNAAVTTTGGLEKWEYTPCAITDVPASLFATLYERGQGYNMNSMLGDWTLSMKPGDVPVFEYHGLGLGSIPVDVVLPVITYPNAANDPPKAVNVAFTLLGVTWVVKSFTLKWGRSPKPRLDANVGGHAGFWGVTRVPMIDVEVETPLVATVDLFQTFQNASVGAWNLAIGSVQYDRYTVLGPQMQFAAPPDEGAEGDVSTSKLSLQLNPSALGSNDELTLRFN